MAISVDEDMVRLDKLYGKNLMYGSELKDLLKDIRNKAVRAAIAAMVREIYDLDKDAIKRDFARITLADWREDIRPEPEERQKLLRVLWWVFGVYFNGDYGELLKLCI